MNVAAEGRAEAAFRSYDFDGDVAYQEFVTSAEVMGSLTAEEAERRLKRRYFRSKIDKDLAREPPVQQQREEVTAPAGSSSENRHPASRGESRASSTPRSRFSTLEQ